MPEPDPRRVRLAALREQLEALVQQINAAPMGSPQRDELADRYGLLLASVVTLREELEGADFSQ
ncbi:hypothetical protein [Synechococcus sp. CCY 0621]|uniref:hypothetical protein n=1 Tax=Synechococcus sp. CCY 0621 TaxID=2815603 RepID=UPI001C243CD0|nr:hypothetical protein [Synechococcus sp. CCY 0621]